MTTTATTTRKVWTAFLRPLTGGAARVIVRYQRPPLADVGGLRHLPAWDFRLVAGSPEGEAFDRSVAEGLVRRFNNEGLINAFIRLNRDKWISRKGDMTLERIRYEQDEPVRPSKENTDVRS